MAGNQPTITGVWGLGKHGETANFKINYTIKAVLFFSPAFWATGSAGKRQSRSIPVELLLPPCLWQEEEESGCGREQALALGPAHQGCSSHFPGNVAVAAVLRAELLKEAWLFSLQSRVGSFFPAPLPDH